MEQVRPSVRAVLIVLALSTTLALAFQGSRPLWDPDEGRYSNIAHEMLADHDWVVPHLDPEREHFAKPPLVYWLTAASLTAFGSSEWAVRLPNALAFIGTALLVLMMMQLLDARRAVMAACIWATMLAPTVAANIAGPDTLLTLFSALGLFGFVASGAATSRDRPHPGGVAIMWLGFGLAFATKGSPALLLLLTCLGWYAVRRRGCELPALFTWSGVLLFVAVGLGWYLWVISREQGVLDYFVQKELLGRVGSAMHSRNPGWRGLVGAFGPMIVAGPLPWTALLLSRRWRASAAQPHEREVRVFLATCVLAPLAVFALAQSRLPLYLLPLGVPFAMLVALWLSPDAVRRRAFVVTVATTAVLLVALKATGAYFPSPRDASRLAAEIRAAADLQRVDELVFVDLPALYGLRHYLGVRIEQVGWGPESARAYRPPQSLCSELREQERSIFVTDSRESDGIIATALDCGYRLQPVATVRDLRLLQPMSTGEYAAVEPPVRR